MTLHLIAIASGGAMGALARYGLTVGFTRWLGPGFPYGTLVANVLGSFIIGVLYLLIVERMLLSVEWRGLLMVGFLGALTTLSSLSLEIILLMQQAAYAKAIMHMLLNIGLSLGATVFGIMLAKQAL